MMIFSVTAVDEQGQTHQFTFALGSLEANLSLIHEIKTQGHSLLSVQLIDQKRVTNLPPETFDVFTSTPLEQLEIQWKAILAG